MKEVRSKIGRNWYALLNLIHAIRFTQELNKRNESLFIDAIKAQLISQKKTKITSKHKSETISSTEMKNLNTTILSPSVSSISQKSPRTKKPKLDKDSGVESTNLSDNEYQKLYSMDILEALRRNQKPPDHSVDSNKLLAPPSSPVTSPSTPRNKEITLDMNISSPIKSGIFEKRKKFFEKSEIRNNYPRKVRSESSSGSSMSCSSNENTAEEINFIQRPGKGYYFN